MLQAIQSRAHARLERKITEGLEQENNTYPEGGGYDPEGEG